MASHHQTTTAPRATTAPVSTTGTWDLDAAHSIAEFSIRHMMIATVKGTFRVKSGNVVFDEADPAAARIEAVLDAASVSTGADPRDGHLRSPDFFDAAQHPEIAFRGTRVTPKGDSEYRVEGDLVIRGIAKPVTLDVEVEGFGIDPWGNRRAGIVATTSFDRSAWDLTWNQAIEAGGVLVGDKVKVALHLQLVQRKA
jgi:polyisoprenoid-binding protein YceI